MPIERRRNFIFGVDEQREHRWVGVHRAPCGISKQRTAEPASVKLSIDRKPADQGGGEHGITWEMLGLFCR